VEITADDVDGAYDVFNNEVSELPDTESVSFLSVEDFHLNKMKRQTKKEED
jgi:hypothetical protein